MTRVDPRKALIVGINDYKNQPLKGCINDANGMYEVLSKHEKGDPNFDCTVLTSDLQKITTEVLRSRIKNLFKGTDNYVVFYFSGHGFLEETGGCLVTQDASPDNPGVSMNWLMEIANQSNASQILIILDCCHSGAIGKPSLSGWGEAKIPNGLTILAATEESDVARERMGYGIFTSILLDGLRGQAADLVGHVTPAGLYNHADSLLSAWQQRPVFKSHVSRMAPIRYCAPKVPKKILRKLPQFFPEKNSSFPLSEKHEETSARAVPEHIEQFKELGKLERAGIVACQSGKTMYFESQNNGACKLTPYGKFVWNMAKNGRI